MKRWILIGIFSCLIAGFLTFNQETFTLFLALTLILGSLLFSSVYFLIKAYKDSKKRHKLSNSLGILITTLTVLILGFYAGGYLSSYSPTSNPSNFQTNILTGQCTLSEFSGVTKPAPWYYESGCDISAEEKKTVLKNQGFGDYVPACQQACEEGNSYFCLGLSHAQGENFHKIGVSCEAIIDCPSINCNY